MSPVSTPVSELSSNRLNQMTTEVREEFPAAHQLLNQQIIGVNLMENTREQMQEAKEDEEAGYARLEDIRQEQQRGVPTR